GGVPRAAAGEPARAKGRQAERPAFDSAAAAEWMSARCREVAEEHARQKASGERGSIYHFPATSCPTGRGQAGFLAGAARCCHHRRTSCCSCSGRWRPTTRAPRSTRRRAAPPRRSGRWARQRL
ncbi:unnamed protein product, partial [Prorocentrum cordatum]